MNERNVQLRKGSDILYPKTLAENVTDLQADGSEVKLTDVLNALIDENARVRRQAKMNALFPPRLHHGCIPDTALPYHAYTYPGIRFHRCESDGKQAIDRYVVDETAKTVTVKDVHTSICNIMGSTVWILLPDNPPRIASITYSAIKHNCRDVTFIDSGDGWFPIWQGIEFGMIKVQLQNLWRTEGMYLHFNGDGKLCLYNSDPSPLGMESRPPVVKARAVDVASIAIDLTHISVDFHDNGNIEGRMAWVLSMSDRYGWLEWEILKRYAPHFKRWVRKRKSTGYATLPTRVFQGESYSFPKANILAHGMRRRKAHAGDTVEWYCFRCRVRRQTRRFYRSQWVEGVVFVDIDTATDTVTGSWFIAR